ncbi:hypothetical protein MY3296_007113 [Beauveria thailandica]
MERGCSDELFEAGAQAPSKARAGLYMYHTGI